MKIRKLPYRQPLPDRIDVSSWYVGLNENNLTPLSWRSTDEQSFPQWDTADKLIVGLDLVLDLPGVMADCHLPHSAKLCLAILWASEGTSLKGCGCKAVMSAGEEVQTVSLRMELRGSDLLHAVDITPSLALDSFVETGDHFTPRLPGTILWNSTHRITLGSSGMRFPVEMLDFAEAANLFPPGAAWLLDWDRESFDRPIHGGLRLYINRSHSVVKRAVSGAGHNGDADGRVREVVLFDVARILITSALENEGFESDLDAYPEGSVGRHIQSLMIALFPRETFESLKSKWQHNRWLFDSHFQEAMKLFQKD